MAVINSGKLLSNHPQSTNYDRFWALTLAAYTAVQPTASRPKARTA